MEKCGNKGRIVALGAIGSGALFVAMNFINAGTNPLLFYIFAGVSGYFNGLIMAAVYACMLDTIEVGQYKTGIRASAFAVSLCHFAKQARHDHLHCRCRRCSGRARLPANQTQNGDVLFWINGFFTWVPGVIGIVVGVVFLFYKLNRERYYEILAKLKGKSRIIPPQPQAERSFSHGREKALVHRMEQAALTTKIRLLDLAHQTLIHIGGDLSVCDMMTAIWQYAIHYDVKNPHWEAATASSCPKGHAAAVTSFSQAAIGCYDVGDIYKEYATNFGRFGMHSCNLANPYVDVSTGSLGHGFPVASGMATALKRKGSSKPRIHRRRRRRMRRRLDLGGGNVRPPV